MTESPNAKINWEKIEQSLNRLEEMIAGTEDSEKIKAGLGMRLALGMAREIRQGKMPGSETGAWVETWMEEHGPHMAEGAVEIAREFLTRPADLVRELSSRLQAAGAPDAD